MGTVSQLIEKHNVRIRIRRGRTEILRDQGTVERFNSTLPERLFGYPYAKELAKSPENGLGDCLKVSKH